MILQSHENDVVNSLGLKQALQSLPVDAQAILHKLYFLDQTHDQVAVAVGCATRTVKRIEQEALLKLRDVL